MKKQILIFGIIVMLIVVGLSGCNETIDDDTNGGELNIEIVDYTVDTSWTTGEGENLTYHYHEGFYHEIPSEANENPRSYIINGTVRNNGDVFVELVEIYIDYIGSAQHVESNSTLIWSSLNVSNLNVSQQKNFSTTLLKTHTGATVNGIILSSPNVYFNVINNISFSLYAYSDIKDRFVGTWKHNEIVTYTFFSNTALQISNITDKLTYEIIGDRLVITNITSGDSINYNYQFSWYDEHLDLVDENTKETISLSKQ